MFSLMDHLCGRVYAFSIFYNSGDRSLGHVLPGKGQFFDNGCFGSRHSVKKATNVRLNLDGAEIQVVPAYRYLGMTLDSTLSFKVQFYQQLVK